MNDLRALTLSLLLAPLVGCSPSASTNACIPGAVQSCPCLGGGSGVQSCERDGTFGTCTCPGTDAGPTADAAPGVDAAGLPDAGDLDAGATPDSGASSCSSPFVSCGGTCIDPSTNPAHCGATSDCAGSNAGHACGGACSGGRCVWDSCAAALAGGETTDGAYLVDADGSGPLPPRDMYCDMTTDGGGWSLVYEIRNDVPDIADPWWGMVDLGTGDAFPTTRAPVPAGSHFVGPTREVRATFANRLGAQYRVRATVVRPDGSVVFDVGSTMFGALAAEWVAAGVSGGAPGTAHTRYFSNRIVLATSGSLPAVGTVGCEAYESSTSGDWEWFDPNCADSLTRVPVFGDSTVVTVGGADYQNSTTLFWIRPWP